MKKTLSTLMLFAFLFSSFSCQPKEDPPASETEKNTYVKLFFNYSDGSYEQSRVMLFKYAAPKDNGARTSGNIALSGDVNLSDGTYGVMEVNGGARIVIGGNVTTGNLNVNNNGKLVEIIVNQGAEFRITSALNQNGKVKIINKGTMYTGNVEMQNGPNDFVNQGKHLVIGDLQITSGDSHYRNCGELTVTNYTNFHAGTYEACDCGYLLTHGLNVNGSNKVSGKGFIKVTGNLNLNGHLTQSPDIQFCYTGHINQREKLGSAKETCSPTCVPDALPLRYTNLKQETIVDSEGNIKGRVSFDVTENTGLVDMKLLTSQDGISWNIHSTEKPEAFTTGKTYQKEFYLRIK